jgi:hypothetical protein
MYLAIELSLKSRVVLRAILKLAFLYSWISKFKYVAFLSSFASSGYASPLISLNDLNFYVTSEMSLLVIATGVRLTVYLLVQPR